jgi:hypothetical protein
MFGCYVGVDGRLNEARPNGGAGILITSSSDNVIGESLVINIPAGTSGSEGATIHYSKGQTRANNATLALGRFGDIVVRVNQAVGTVDLVVDFSGYFQ